MSVEQTLQAVLTNPQVLAVWGALVAVSLLALAYDLRANNSGIAPLMKFVWGLTVLYSGPLGLAIYAYSGRSAIDHDSLWRRGFRSVAHCYSGCGAGEVIGVTVAAGLLALASHWVIAITFGCAYVLGYSLTVGPLMQEGESFATAMTDALYTETPSITVMEIAAIGTDVWLAGEAHIGQVLFWSALIFSLTIGLVVAYPVNVLLVSQGVKEGMQNPKEAAA
ncbi:DUF4396 domain-containing protein [Halorarius halobius]|uniref:DUF4396 domain-containing protein n=1 Tax=Halorarius halobius TaxID=2962671 RepID=UPI0020CF0A2F|nr:DUF4396 domain-containing protein [Halorarius halobius]